MKKVQAAVLVIGLVASLCSGVAQQKSEVGIAGAKAAVIQFINFSKQQALRSPEARKLLIGEALQWDTPTFGNLATSPDKTILLSKETAVARVQWYGQDNYVADFYFYLISDVSWKIVTMRRLALTGIVEMAYNGLKAKKSLTSEERDELSNLELVLASDEALRAWFGKNLASMNRLRALTHSIPKGEYVFLNHQDKNYPEIGKLLKELHFSGLEVQQDGNVQMTIGGVTDNTVGFIYSASNHPPPISPGPYIWVEQVADKWFLFRTT